MQYIDYVSMSLPKRLAYRLGNVVRAIPGALKKAGIKIWNVLRRGALAIKNGFKSYFTTFRHGDFRTRLSYILMGSGSFLRGQVVKGFGFLFLQLAFLAYMNSFGIKQLALLPTLGKAVRYEVWNEAKQIFEYIQGDNSMLILLFSVWTIAIIFAFLVIYFANIRTAYCNQLTVAKGKKLPNIYQDITGCSIKTCILPFFRCRRSAFWSLPSCR